jgi:hypothetical protein
MRTPTPIENSPNGNVRRPEWNYDNRFSLSMSFTFMFIGRAIQQIIQTQIHTHKCVSFHLVYFNMFYRLFSIIELKNNNKLISKETSRHEFF